MARVSPLALPLLVLVAGCALRALVAPAFATAPATRREVLAGAAAGTVALGGALPALADAQGEPARAFKKYGEAILALEPAIEKGNLDAISKKIRKVELFLSAYRNSPSKKAEAEPLIDALISAVEAKDAGKAKTAYSELLAKTQLKKLLAGLPVPRGSRIIDTSSSIGGMGKLVKQADFERARE